MIRVSIIGGGVRFSPGAALNKTVMFALTQGGFGAVAPYRASVPRYSKFGWYNSPGGAVRMLTADRQCYAIHPDSTIRAFSGPGTDLGDKAGQWSLYTASVDPTHGPECGPNVTESITVGVDGANTVYSVKVMGLTRVAIATTFGPPHVGSTQREFAATGQMVTARHQLVAIVAQVSSGLPSGDFGAFNGSLDVAGAASASGTIRQDSGGSATYSLFGANPSSLTITYGVPVYCPSNGDFTQLVVPMTATAYLSLLPV